MGCLEIICIGTTRKKASYLQKWSVIEGPTEMVSIDGKYFDWRNVCEMGESLLLIFANSWVWLQIHNPRGMFKVCSLYTWMAFHTCTTLVFGSIIYWMQVANYIANGVFRFALLSAPGLEDYISMGRAGSIIFLVSLPTVLLTSYSYGMYVMMTMLRQVRREKRAKKNLFWNPWKHCSK